MFSEIHPDKMEENAFHLIGKQWMLITAGSKDQFNTMTASWGGLGFLWNAPVAIIFLRPQRFTYRFVEESDCFTLSFFESQYKDILNYCGSHSGKDVDKVKNSGLIPVYEESGCVYFEQAKLVLLCEKIYFNDIDPAHFIDRSIQRNYPDHDYHRMYIGKVLKCLIKN